MPEGKGMSKSLGLRLQKKMLGMGVKSKDAAKHFIDDESGALLDVLYELALKVSGDVKTAKKLLKDVVKIAVKLGLLYRHNQFNQEEIEIGSRFRKKFKTCAFTMMSYHDVAFTFDEDILSEAFEECKGLCQEQIARHLTAKSVGRVENVFSFFGSPETLTKLYTEPEYKELLEQLNTGLTVIVDKL